MAEPQIPSESGSTDTSEKDQAETNRLNAVVSSHLKRHLPKMLDEGFAPLKAMIEGLQGPKAPEAKADTKETPSKDDGRLSKLEKELQTEKAERAKEREETKAIKAFGELRGELAGKLRPEAVDMASEWLFKAQKRVSYNDDGELTFTIGGEQHSLKEGVAKFLKSKEAALFLPAPGASGSAKTQPSQRVPARTTPDGKPVAEDPMTKAMRLIQNLPK